MADDDKLLWNPISRRDPMEVFPDFERRLALLALMQAQTYKPSAIFKGGKMKTGGKASLDGRSMPPMYGIRTPSALHASKSLGMAPGRTATRWQTTQG
jgi:hypothetical protein